MREGACGVCRRNEGGGGLKRGYPRDGALPKVAAHAVIQARATGGLQKLHPRRARAGRGHRNAPAGDAFARPASAAFTPPARERVNGPARQLHFCHQVLPAQHATRESADDTPRHAARHAAEHSARRAARLPSGAARPRQDPRALISLARGLKR